MERKKDTPIFDIYAHEYDMMTNAKTRVPFHTEEIKAMIDKFDPATVLDAGCATGLTSMLFAKQGMRTTGIDRSLAMLREAKKKYDALDYPLKFQRAHFEKLPKSMAGKFDLIVCLANSISGVGTLTRLRQSLKGFYASLRPGGSLVLQLLNYSSMKESVLFPIKATRNGPIVYERFSERRGKRFYLYVTRLDLDQKPLSLEVFRHEFDNFTVHEVVRSIKFSNFKNIERYGDLKMTKKFGRTSRDLVMVCRRS